MQRRRAASLQGEEDSTRPKRRAAPGEKQAAGTAGKAYPHSGAGYKGGKRDWPGWPARSDDSMLTSSPGCVAGASAPLQVGMQHNTILAALRMTSVVMRPRSLNSTAR